MITVNQQKLANISDLKSKIDAKAASIYARWTRFEAEYRERETAAAAFAAAGYNGDPGIWVESFADSAGVSYQAAAQTIIAQAAGLRNVLAQIAALRMRKYELNSLVGQSAVDRANEIMADMDTVAAAIS